MPFATGRHDIHGAFRRCEFYGHISSRPSWMLHIGPPEYGHDVVASGTGSLIYRLAHTTRTDDEDPQTSWC